MSSVVPAGWISSQLGSLGVFSKGKGISKKETLPDGIPCIRYAEIYTVYDFRIKTFKSFISPITAKTSKKLTKNDIIFAGSGETVEDIGKSVAFTLDCDAYVGGDSIVLSPSSDLDSTFLSYQLNDNIRRSQLRKLGQGSSVIHIYSSGLQEVILSLPPLPEQKKIASILTSVDEVIENTQKQIDKLQDLKKATMNELLTKGIGHTEFKDSELGRIPKSWEVKTIDDVIKFTGGAQPPRSSFIFAPKEGYVRLLQIRDYKSDRFATYIPEKLSRRNCNEDDVLIGRYGPPIFQILRGKAGSYNVALIKSEPRNDSLLKGYMYHFLTRSDLFHLIDSLSQRTSGQTGIDLDALKSFGFPFPPIEEQHRILEILDHMDAANKRLLNKLTQTQSLKKSLMQDLLTGKVRVTVN